MTKPLSKEKRMPLFRSIRMTLGGVTQALRPTQFRSSKEVTKRLVKAASAAPIQTRGS